jgi:thioredoxin 1
LFAGVVDKLSRKSYEIQTGHHIAKEATMSNAVAVTDSDFVTEVLESTTPVLLDFWAAWCGPCQSMGPVIDALAAEYLGKVKVMKMNVDENRETPAKFGIRGIPTLILFDKGQVVEKIVGAQPKAAVDTMLKKVLA